MKTRRIVMTAVLFSAASLLAFAQGGRTRPRPVPRYDTSTEASFKGVVENVKEIDHAGFRGKGLHATLKTERGTFDVHFGPVAFMVAEKMTVAQGDQLEVVGSKVKDGATDSIIARTVTKGGRTVTFRNALGVPVWSGGRRKNR